MFEELVTLINEIIEKYDVAEEDYKPVAEIIEKIYDEQPMIDEEVDIEETEPEERN